MHVLGVTFRSALSGLDKTEGGYHVILGLQKLVAYLRKHR